MVVDEVAQAIQAASEGAQVAVALSVDVVPLNTGVSIPAWLVEMEAGRQPSDSSDDEVIFAPGAAQSAPCSVPLAARPWGHAAGTT